MAHRTRKRCEIAGACVLGAALSLNVLHSSAAAVLPVTDDVATAGAAGLRAGVLSAGALRAMTGHWMGRAENGKQVSLILKVERGGVLGHAFLHGVVPGADRAMRPLMSPTLNGKTIAFSIEPAEGAKAVARGVFTFVSSNAARLELRGSGAPLSICLTRVS